MNTLHQIIIYSATSPDSQVSLEVVATIDRLVREIDATDIDSLLSQPATIYYPSDHEACVQQFFASSKWVLASCFPGIGQVTFSPQTTGIRVRGLENQNRRLDLVTVLMVDRLVRLMRECVSKTKPGVPCYLYQVMASEWHLIVFRIGFPRLSFIIETVRDDQGTAHPITRVI